MLYFIIRLNVVFKCAVSLSQFQIERFELYVRMLSFSNITRVKKITATPK